MASSLAVAVSSVPADRWPNRLLWLKRHPFLLPFHSFTFLITPPVYCIPPLAYQGSLLPR